MPPVSGTVWGSVKNLHAQRQDKTVTEKSLKIVDKIVDPPLSTIFSDLAVSVSKVFL